MLATFREFAEIDIYTSSPPEDGLSSQAYLSQLRQVAHWSDRRGCRGMLMYTDNREPDPWVLAQDVIAHTNTLSPLIALQPVYMHPYAAAQKVAALARMYGRAVDLNLVAGGFRFDLAALGDFLEHDARYERLSEYGSLMMKLLTGERTTSQGPYYKVSALQLESGVCEGLLPKLTVSGSSPGGRKCAGVLKATAVIYPKPLHPAQSHNMDALAEMQIAALPVGIRIGILARQTTEQAWEVAKARFPENPAGQAMHKTAVQASDSSWLLQLSDLKSNLDVIRRDIYWLGPFGSDTYCPYLVGSYDDVALYLSAYLRGGVRLIILDCPREEEDLDHVHAALQGAICYTIDSPPLHVESSVKGSSV